MHLLLIIAVSLSPKNCLYEDNCFKCIWRKLVWKSQELRLCLSIFFLVVKPSSTCSFYCKTEQRWASALNCVVQKHSSSVTLSVLPLTVLFVCVCVCVWVLSGCLCPGTIQPVSRKTQQTTCSSSFHIVESVNMAVVVFRWPRWPVARPVLHFVSFQRRVCLQTASALKHTHTAV